MKRNVEAFGILEPSGIILGPAFAKQMLHILSIKVMKRNLPGFWWTLSIFWEPSSILLRISYGIVSYSKSCKA